MPDNIDFKILWSNRQMPLQDVHSIIRAAQQYRKKALLKLVSTNIMLLATCVFIGYIWYIFQPQYITTKIGIVLVMLAIVIFLVVYNQAIPLLLKNNYEADNQTFLQQLIQLKQKQSFLQTTILTVYFILLSTGIALYMIEYIEVMPLWARLPAYLFTTAWMLFNWLYIRPRTIKKQRAKLDVLINSLQDVKNQ